MFQAGRSLRPATTQHDRGPLRGQLDHLLEGIGRHRVFLRIEQQEPILHAVGQDQNTVLHRQTLQQHLGVDEVERVSLGQFELRLPVPSTAYP